MKKLISIAAATATACALAALDVAELSTVDILAPTAVTANTTNATEFVAAGFKGVCEVVITATPANGRTIATTIYGRNSADDAWSIYTSTINTETNSVVVKVPFVGHFAPAMLKLAISPNANITASAFVLGNE